MVRVGGVTVVTRGVLLLERRLEGEDSAVAWDEGVKTGKEDGRRLARGLGVFLKTGL